MSADENVASGGGGNKKHWTAAEINDRLRERYQAPECAIFFNVANGTGMTKMRYADAVCMGLFPSRGLYLSGFEVKVDRRDWKRELDQPEKVEQSVYRYMDFWWIVAPPGVVLPGELPKTWGLMETCGDGLRTKVDAPKIEPQTIAREFLAALLRRAHESIKKPQDAELKKAREEASKSSWESAERLYNERAEQLTSVVKAFEDAAGVSLQHRHEWDAKHLGEQFRQFRAEKDERLIPRLESVASQMRALADTIDHALKPTTSEVPA